MANLIKNICLGHIELENVFYVDIHEYSKLTKKLFFKVEGDDQFYILKEVTDFTQNYATSYELGTLINLEETYSDSNDHTSLSGLYDVLLKFNYDNNCRNEAFSRLLEKQYSSSIKKFTPQKIEEPKEEEPVEDNSIFKLSVKVYEEFKDETIDKQNIRNRLENGEEYKPNTLKEVLLVSLFKVIIQLPIIYFVITFFNVAEFLIIMIIYLMYIVSITSLNVFELKDRQREKMRVNNIKKANEKGKREAIEFNDTLKSNLKNLSKQIEHTNNRELEVEIQIS